MATLSGESSRSCPKVTSKYTSVVLVLFSCCLIQVVVTYGIYSRSREPFRNTGKIRADLTGVELADYRFGLGDPYVMFYERDYYRGSVYFQRLGKNCTNLPESRQNWASSVDVQKRCITICDELECKGNCAKVYAHPEDPNNKGVPRLSLYSLNDKVKSVKFCYS